MLSHIDNYGLGCYAYWLLDWRDTATSAVGGCVPARLFDTPAILKPQCLWILRHREAFALLTVTCIFVLHT